MTDSTRTAIQPQDGITVGDLIAQLAAIGDFGAVVQFTSDFRTFYVATCVSQYPDGGVLVQVEDPWENGS